MKEIFRNELKADRDKWKMKFEVSQGALNEERIVVQEMKTADEKVKELQAIQIQDWKLLYEKEKQKIKVIFFSINN